MPVALQDKVKRKKIIYIPVHYVHVMSSTMQALSVCPGGQINLTCQATPNGTLLQWNLTILGRSQPELRFISSDGNTASVSPLIAGQTVFQFFRTSTSPLISVMIIDNVSTSLNGTRVECSYGGGVMETTVINVIRNGTYLSSITLCYINIYHQRRDLQRCYMRSTSCMWHWLENGNHSILTLTYRKTKL